MKQLRYLSVVLPGTWTPYRLKVTKQMKEILKPGDILCCYGSHCAFGFFSIADLIKKVTDSGYSHAAVVTDVGDDIIIADIVPNGLRRQFSSEWVDEVSGEDILVLRYKGNPEIAIAAAENAKSLTNKIVLYDKTFTDKSKFYCTGFVIWCYELAGVKLCEYDKIGDLPGWKWWYKFISSIDGIYPETPVYCIGNEKIGLLSSTELVEVCRLRKPNEHN